MKCPRCGNELRQSTKDPNYGLCDNCRKKYKWLEETVPQKKNKNNTNIFILILIISIFMLAFSIWSNTINTRQFDDGYLKLLSYKPPSF